jgi:NADH-ubiquinone oxidoreductase chain 3
MNNLFFLFLFVPLLAFILLALNVLLAPHKPDESKLSAYECGFIPVFGQTRTIFQIHFYSIAMLFLLFDLELLLLFPVGVSLYQINLFGFSTAILFFFVLTIGFILEIGSGAISLKNFTENKEIKQINQNKRNLHNRKYLPKSLIRL